MTEPAHAHQLLEKTVALLPVSQEDIIFRGIAAEVSERILVLKKGVVRLQGTYGSVRELERRIQNEGVSPEDHTLYTDLLEWRAIAHERSELLCILESL
ncbi:MAG: hypothetical protein KAS81_09380 [Anaerolineales bacterium]|nr:hypothetical protein [Anaerolineales bacterium]